MSRPTLSWRRLEPPRRPAAVLGRADAARSLARALAAGRPGDGGLRAAAADGVLLVLGPEESLPWAEGVIYLGRDDGVLLPTTLAPSVPTDVLRLALRERLGEADLVVVPGQAFGFTTAAAAPDPAWLQAVAEGRT